eukprot:TRINITY_DN1454_c0_g1_i1.p1 TRINITY_DN1454_c0_g1~~TRINITY_DN1454_c0_g1_i1.p1  ORF type:complete len:849 (+),score=292.53 TRINITY_DN1454_c0_g1_i1:266-2548(+)
MAASPASPSQVNVRMEEGTDSEKMLKTIFQLQQQLIDRDAIIHELHHKAQVGQDDENRKLEIKRGFSVIEKRHVDTADTAVVLRDSMHHLLYTVTDIFGGCAGIFLLDVPYNGPIGAVNSDLKVLRSISTYWADQSSLPASVLRALENLPFYRDVITQKKGKVFSDWEVKTMKDEDATLHDVRRLMAVPVVVDGVSIAVLSLVNGEYTERDPQLLKEVLMELWTSNVQPLINIALDTQRKKETESKLVMESLLRDEIILSLDTILDEVVKQALAGKQAHGKSTSEHLWRVILQRVADFFEEYFSCDTILAVTNTDANFRIQNLQMSGRGSVSCGSHKAASVEVSEGLSFIHYAFSESLKHVRKTKMKHLSHPNLKDAKLMRKTIESGEPLYSPDCKELKFPCGHMKMNSVLLVPIIFCEEPVGMLGLANGDFSMSSGRILQSVFTTFWSMIVKSTMLSESQSVLNSAIPMQISERVKAGEHIADSYNHATVLFADIVGFTEFTKDLDPADVVEYSNLIFARLDDLVAHYSLEKIKVIGDCYMVAGGLVDKSGNVPASPTAAARVERAQVKEMMNFAMRILQEAKKINESPSGRCSKRLMEKLSTTPLQFRIGVAMGSLTAGVFGNSKVQYDILGATVNLASRLESTGTPGHIHVSASVRDILAERGYRFEKRKPICLKGLGLQQTYFLEGKSSSQSNPPIHIPSSSPRTLTDLTRSPTSPHLRTHLYVSTSKPECITPRSAGANAQPRGFPIGSPQKLAR